MPCPFRNHRCPSEWRRGSTSFPSNQAILPAALPSELRSRTRKKRGLLSCAQHGRRRIPPRPAPSRHCQRVDHDERPRYTEWKRTPLLMERVHFGCVRGQSTSTRGDSRDPARPGPSTSPPKGTARGRSPARCHRRVRSIMSPLVDLPNMPSRAASPATLLPFDAVLLLGNCARRSDGTAERRAGRDRISADYLEPDQHCVLGRRCDEKQAHITRPTASRLSHARKPRHTPSRV
jgi:hypothetical protein